MAVRRAAKALSSIEAAAPRQIPVARPLLPPAEAVLPYLRQMDEARWYSNFGPLLTTFEDRLAVRHGAETCVATAVNATQALALVLQAMDLPAGALVAMPSWTFVATAHAVVQAGLRPWFLDVDPRTAMLEPEATQAVLARAPGAVCAVIPVAAHGCMPDMAGWRRFREATGLPVIIDAAAAFDAAGEAELPLIVSLHATKVLGIGEGGYLASRDRALIDRVRQLTTFGFRGSRESAFAATNAKLSEVSAATGLAALDAWPHDRLRYIRAAQLMRIALTTQPQVGFQEGWGVDWISSVCVVTLPPGAADAVEATLLAEGVQTRRWWGAGCHASPAFADWPRDRLPNTEALAGRTIGLPFAVDLDPADIQHIARALARALA